MTISKMRLFVLLFAVSVLPFLLHKMIWLINSKPAVAEMRFLGHTMEVQGISEHPVFRFRIGRNTVFFNGNFDFGFTPGERVPIRYQKNDPTDAKVNSFMCIWLDSLLYILPQLLLLAILFLTPDKWHPVFPRGSKIRFGTSPFLTITPAG